MLNALNATLSRPLSLLGTQLLPSRKAPTLPIIGSLTTMQEGYVGGVLVVRDDTYSRSLCWQVRDAKLRGEIGVIAAFPSEGAARAFASSLLNTAH